MTHVAVVILSFYVSQEILNPNSDSNMEKQEEISILELKVLLQFHKKEIVHLNLIVISLCHPLSCASQLSSH